MPKKVSKWLDDAWAKFKQKTGIDPDKNAEDRLFMYLFIISLGIRLLWLDRPIGSLIFDETYYVNVARIILGLPFDQKVYANATPGIDPNMEHPPVAKLLIALSIAVFGNNGYGWRIPSVVFGMLSIFAFYLLMKRLTSVAWVPIIATFMFTFDNLVFVHSRVATLDIFVVGFMILGFYFYFVDRPVLSAVMLALSTLSKVGGLYGFVIIVAYHFVKTYRSGELKANWNKALTWFEKYALVYIISGVGVLTVLDWGWGAFKDPWAAFSHMGFIYEYTVRLTRDPLQGIESYPWQWWFQPLFEVVNPYLNQFIIPYLKVVVNTIEQPSGRIIGSRASILFLGKMNSVVLVLSWLSVPYLIWDYYKHKTPISLFALLWFAFTYLPFYPASIFGHRIMYIHYFLPTVPAISAANAHAVVNWNPPKIVAILILAAALIAFGLDFPFKQIP